MSAAPVTENSESRKQTAAPTEERTLPKTRGALSFACAAATVLYLLLLLAKLVSLPIAPAQDPSSYLYQATHFGWYLAADHTTNSLAYHGPGFPLLIRFFLLLTSNALTAAKIGVFAIAFGTLWVSWKLLHRWLEPQPARFAYLLALSLLPLFDVLGALMSDAGAALCALTGLYLLDREAGKREEERGKREKRNAVLCLLCAGLLFGGAYLFRYVYKIIPLCVLAFWLLFDERHWKEKLQRSAVMLLGFGLIFGGWAVVCRQARGEWFPDRNHAAMVWQALDHSNSWIHFTDYAREYPTPGSVIAKQSLPLLRHWGKTVVHVPADFLLPTFLLGGVFLPLGGFITLRKLDRSRLLFLSFAIPFLIATGFFWYETRTLLPLMVWFCGLISLALHSEFVPERLSGWHAEGSRLWKTLGRLPLRGLLLVVILGAQSALFVHARPWHSVPSPLEREAAEAGCALRKIAPPGSSLLATTYSIGLYADMPTQELHQALPHDPQFADPLELGQRAQKASYLAYTEGQSNYEYPGLAFLLTPDSPQVPANFQRVYQSSRHPIIVIYHIRPLPDKKREAGMKSSPTQMPSRAARH